jgi:peroxiredoxin
LEVPPTSSVPRSQIGPRNGYYAPNFSLNNVNTNATTSLSDYEGQAVIIFFWATWCPYCKAEMPSIEMIYKAYADKGLTVLAVDVAEDASMARKYRDAHSLTFPILDDAGRDVSSKYEVTAFPTFFFVDPSGVISFINIGSVGYWGIDNKVKTMLGLP